MACGGASSIHARSLLFIYPFCSAARSAAVALRAPQPQQAPEMPRLWCRAPNWSIVAHPLGNAGARALRVPKGNAAAPSRRRSAQLPRRFASFASTCFGSPGRPPANPPTHRTFFPGMRAAEMNDVYRCRNRFGPVAPARKHYSVTVLAGAPGRWREDLPACSMGARGCV